MPDTHRNLIVEKILPPDSWNELADYSKSLRRQGSWIVLTSGAFDIFHIGHLEYLLSARSHGDVLIVAVNSDEAVRKKKGANRPVYPQDQRAMLVAGLSCVDRVMVASDVRQRLLHCVRPDTRIYSETAKISEEDYARDLDILRRHGGVRVILPEQHPVHSSDIIAMP